MKNENYVHIKMEYLESLETKRNLLSSERDLIKLFQIIKKYHLLRSSELILKLKIEKKIKELKSNVAKLEQNLPKIKIPKILEKEKEEFESEKFFLTKRKTKTGDYDKELEKELMQIQEKLKKLEPLSEY